MSMIQLNPLLLDLAKTNAGIRKAAFIPAGQAGGDPSQGGAPPPGGDPSQGGAPPPGGDPSMGGAPPPGAPPGGDPAAAGGAPPGPPPEMMGMIQQVVTQAVQQAMQGGQPGMPGAPGAAGPKKSKGGDEVALQLYKTNVFLMAIVRGLIKSGVEIEIPPEAMLGPPPGSDPAMAGAMGANVQGMGGAPGQDPNAAAGQDPNAQPQQQPMNFAPALAPKTAEDDTDFDVEDAALSLGIPFDKLAAPTPVPPAITELFPQPKQAQANEPSVQDKANMVLHMINAGRVQREVVLQ